MFRNRTAHLSLSTVATMLRLHRFGELHPILGDRHRWIPPDERTAAEQRAWDEMRAAGLVERKDRLDIDLLDALPLLHGGAVEFFGIINTGTITKYALVSAVGSAALVAVSDGNNIALTGMSNQFLAETLVRQIPECRPGGGGTINVSLDEINSNGRSTSGGYTSDRLDTGSNDLALYQELISLPRTGSGELHVATRHEGRRTTVDHPLCYVDTSKGRWFMQETRQRGGASWIVAAPATTTVLAERLNTALRTLT